VCYKARKLTVLEVGTLKLMEHHNITHGVGREREREEKGRERERDPHMWTRDRHCQRGSEN
jgi:hypothetical protein